MAIILSEQDLKLLYQNPAAIDELLQLIEASLAAHSRNEVAGQIRVETTAVNPKKKYRIMTAAVPEAGCGMRITALFRSAKDAYFHLLFDNESGDLLALVAGRQLNIWRTGSPAGVASRYLAPPDARTLAILGCGRQGRGQLIAIRRALPSLDKVRVYSPTATHRIAFAKEMSEWLDVTVEAVSSPRDALQDAEVVSLATNSRTSVLEADWISAGALVISITNGQLPPELVAGSRVIVSWKEEILHGEAPRLPYAAMIAAGTWSADMIAGELGDVILGKIPARANPGETIIFESAGMPSLDTTATAWAYRWASDRQLGTEFSLD